MFGGSLEPDTRELAKRCRIGRDRRFRVPLPAPAVPRIRVHRDEPAVTRASTGIDQLYINPGAIIEEDGRLHMFANLFTAWPGHVDIAHLASEDGVAWEAAASGPVLTSDDVPLTGSGIDVSTGFRMDDGTYVLVFQTVENGRPWVLGRATAPGPDGPWTVDGSPILEPGPAGTWDAGGLSWPSVVPTDDGYAMYYTGMEQMRGRGSIGLATSTDGIAWTKHEGPVLRAEEKWERLAVDRPRVVSTPAGLAWCTRAAALPINSSRGRRTGSRGVATASGPVINADAFPVKGLAWDAALIDIDGTLHYYLEIGAATGTGGTQVYLATATLP